MTAPAQESAVRIAPATPVSIGSWVTTYPQAARICRMAVATSEGIVLCQDRTLKGCVCRGFGQYGRWVWGSYCWRDVVLEMRSPRQLSGDRPASARRYD